MEKRRSKFVQQQKYNKHLQNKSISNMNHNMNKTNRKIEAYKQDYENSIREIMSDFLKENGLDPEKIPNNSRILVYELLKKNLKTKLEGYTKYIEEHPEDENISQYYDAQTLCNDSLEQLDWVYDWTRPISHPDYDLGEGYGNDIEFIDTKLQDSGKKFDSILDIPEIINSCNIDKDTKDDIKYDFYRFCKFIKKNDLDKYYIYISNTIKNLKILNSEDPIVEFMLKPYTNKESTTDCES